MRLVTLGGHDAFTCCRKSHTFMLHSTSCLVAAVFQVGIPPGGGAAGPGLDGGGVWRRRGDTAVEVGFWGAGVSFLAVGLGAGIKPGGGDSVAGLGGGMKPTTAGRETGLDLDGSPAGGWTSCVPGPDLGGA